MLENETADIDEVAAAIGRKPQWLKRNWLKMHNNEGFPRPLPGSDWRWPRRMVELWLIAGGVVAKAANSNHVGADLITLQRQAHHERYGIAS
ncbi:hypothetical protein M1D80_11930 [Phyllobacteriaceae bacterium JZ32]